MAYVIRPIQTEERAALAAFMRTHWGDDSVVVHETVYHPSTLPGFLALDGTTWVGVVTYHLADDQCEIVTLDSLRPGEGIGTALVAAVREVAQRAGCRRLWLITTNDNLAALRFYQKRGFVLKALYPEAVTRARRIKPQIPRVGENGIPIRDEIELEMRLEIQP
jgi:GNAT superfamily N-acetyltransferase